MKLIKYIHLANIVLKTYQRPLTVIIRLNLYRLPVSVKMKNGETRQIKSVNDIVRDYLKMKYNLNLIYDETWTDPYSVFIDNDYKFIPVKGKIVLDVEANIGDSSLYFLLKGADKVISVEPFPHYYNILIRNIEENEYQNKIIPINAVIGSEIKYVKMNTDKEMTTGIQVELSNSGKEIEMIDLDYLIDLYNIENGALKMDCEGCEYDSILTSNDETLRHFEYIMLEYHYGYDSLFKKLKEARYKVKCTKPKSSYNRCAKDPYMNIGYICAENW